MFFANSCVARQTWGHVSARCCALNRKRVLIQRRLWYRRAHIPGKTVRVARAVAAAMAPLQCSFWCAVQWRTTWGKYEPGIHVTALFSFSFNFFSKLLIGIKRGTTHTLTAHPPDPTHPFNHEWPRTSPHLHTPTHSRTLQSHLHHHAPCGSCARSCRPLQCILHDERTIFFESCHTLLPEVLKT